jgi:FKBP-type peptidyl-prolyl cis-trans isomerase SlyD
LHAKKEKIIKTLFFLNFLFFYLPKHCLGKKIFNRMMIIFAFMKKLLIAIFLVILSSGCVNKMAVENGDQVSVEYSGKLDDNTVFDSNVGKSPLIFTAGAGQMIAGFDAAVIGMNINQEKTFTLPPEQAYGNRMEDLIQRVNQSELKAAIGTEPIIGMVLSASNGMNGTITGISEGIVIVDFNHELAGKSLTFTIKILGIQKK